MYFKKILFLSVFFLFSLSMMPLVARGGGGGGMHAGAEGMEHSNEMYSGGRTDENKLDSSNQMYSGNRADINAGQSNRMYSGNVNDINQGQSNRMYSGNVNNNIQGQSNRMYNGTNYPEDGLVRPYNSYGLRNPYLNSYSGLEYAQPAGYGYYAPPPPVYPNYQMNPNAQTFPDSAQANSMYWNQVQKMEQQ